MKRLLVWISAFVPIAAGADTLGDMKAALSQLAARPPVQATYSLEQHVKAEGRFGNDKTERRLSLEVAQNASGISITIPQDLLDKAAHNAGDGSLAAIRPSSVVDALDFREALLTMLDGARVVAEQRLPFRGQPARRLALTLKPRPRTEGGRITIGSVTTEDQMDVWIGDDHLPIAAERVKKTTGGFLFIKGTFVGRTSYTFAHAPGRLIVARMVSTDTGSGMGQNIDSSAVETLTLH
jgi:hypothetical protein